MARISDMHKRWMKDASYRKAYADLENEFALASEVIGVRNRAGLTQEALARKMGTTQPVVARLEAGRGHPSMRTLERLAKATGSRLIIRFAPNEIQSLTTSRRRSRDFMKQLKKNKRPVLPRVKGKALPAR